MLIRLSLLLLTLVLFFQCSALVRKAPTPQLHSVFDNKPRSFYMQEGHRTFAPDYGPQYEPYQQGPKVSYRHKMAVGTAMIIGGSAMAASGVAFAIAQLKEGSYFEDPAGDTLATFFSIASVLLVLGGAALITSGIIVRRRYKGKED